MTSNSRVLTHFPPADTYNGTCDVSQLRYHAANYKDSDRGAEAYYLFGHGDGGEIQLDALPHDDPTLKADLAWHVRAWGRWVLAKARKELAPYYPTYAEFEPLKPGKDYEPRAAQLLEVDEDGVPQIDPMNAEFDDAYLKNPQINIRIENRHENVGNLMKTAF